MRRTALAIVLGFFLCAPWAVRAQGEIPLEFQEIKGAAPAVAADIEKTVSPLPGKPYKVKALPADVTSHVTFFGVYLAGKPIVIMLDMTDPPKLYVDADGDFDLSNDKPAEGTLEKGTEDAASPNTGRKTYDFGTFRAEGGEGRAPVIVRAKIQSYGRGDGGDYSYLNLYPAAVRSGQARLGDKQCTVQLVDADFDGRYDGMAARGTSRDKWDMISIGPAGQGAPGPQAASSEQAQPLSKLMPWEDKYYAVRVAPDGSTIRFEDAHPALGTLEVGRTDVKLTLMSDSGLFALSGQDKWQLPAGRYWTERVALSKADDKGDVWTLSGNASTGKLKAFDVAEGQTLAMKAGPPLVVSTSADSMGARTFSVGVTVTGQAGETYTAGATKKGTMESAPTFRILDESGKVLDAGSFQYG